MRQDDVEFSRAQALVPLEVSQVNFYGDALRVLLVEVNGERVAAVPLRQFCDYLGVDWSGQRQRLLRDDVLSSELVKVTVLPELSGLSRGAKQRYNVVCLPLDLLPGWLFGIAPSRVKPVLASQLHRYRRECFRVLWRAVQQGQLWGKGEIDSSEGTIYSWLTRVRARVWRACERAAQLQLPATLTVDQWLRTLEHFEGKCAYCRQRPGVIIEHFIPLPLMGTVAENCVPSCYGCNVRKGDTHPDFITAIPRSALGDVRAYLVSISD